MQRTRKRILLYYCISGLVVSMLLIQLMTKCYDFYYEPGNKDYELNAAINQRNQNYSKGNQFGFTDKERITAKPKGVYRIAVLGDSFVWGDGLPYEQAWSHLLEQKILAQYDSVEVLHWGRCGWSSLDEFNFFKEHGKDYGIDLLIIGWVDNDVDIGKCPLIAASDPARQYPILYKVCRSLAERWSSSGKLKEYNIWLQKLYENNNLEQYLKLMQQFRTYLGRQNVDALVAMTPGPFDAATKERFKIAEPVIEKAGFKRLNLYAPSEKKLSIYDHRLLQANRINGHPGKLMAEEFATEVMDYLQLNSYFQRSDEIKKKSKN